MSLVGPRPIRPVFFEELAHELPAYWQRLIVRPGPHRARAGAARLRDVDGGEARARSRVDRRPLRPPLPAHRLRDRLARAEAVAARARIARRLIAGSSARRRGASSRRVARRCARRRAPREPHLLVGVDDDTLKWTREPARASSAGSSRSARRPCALWVPWHGEARPTGRGSTSSRARRQAAQRDTRRARRLRLRARHADDTAGAAHASARTRARALALVPHASAVVVWNEANSPTYWSGTAAQYAVALARCYDVLHRRGLTVLDSTASAHAPRRFLRDARRRVPRERTHAAARRRVRSQPVPATSDRAAERRARAPASSARATTRGSSRSSATAFGRAPDDLVSRGRLPVDGAAPPGSHYDGRENVATIAPALQAQQLGDAIRLAACQPHVRAFFNFELVDETRLAGWQSGLVWRGVHRKPAAAAFAAAARQAAAGCRPPIEFGPMCGICGIASRSGAPTSTGSRR